MKKYMVLGILITSLLLTGCTSVVQPLEKAPVSTPEVQITPQEAKVHEVVERDYGSKDVAATPSYEEPQDYTWISPSKVEVSNFFPGARAEYPLTIHNGSTEPARFSVSYMEPTREVNGFVKAPEDARKWLQTEKSVELQPGETTETLVAIELPEDVETPDKWEFWVAVKDTTQSGIVQTEVASRWMVEMK